MSHQQRDDGRAGPPAKHEEQNIRVAVIVLVAGILLVSVVVIYFWVGALGHHYLRNLPARPGADTDLISERTRPPGPGAADTLVLVRQRLEREQRAHLEGYAWVDQPRGVARIPLDRAMEITARNGLPDFGPIPASKKTWNPAPVEKYPVPAHDRRRP
jgi:hypothetical protein